MLDSLKALVFDHPIICVILEIFMGLYCYVAFLSEKDELMKALDCIGIVMSIIGCLGLLVVIIGKKSNDPNSSDS